MNTKKGDVLNRTISVLAIGACVFLANMEDATAHPTEYRPYVVTRHYVYNQPLAFPGWLRGNREFQYWYLGSHYRYLRYPDWQQVYDVYRFERRYQVSSRRNYRPVTYDRSHRKKDSRKDSRSDRRSDRKKSRNHRH